MGVVKNTRTEVEQAKMAEMAICWTGMARLGMTRMGVKNA